MFSGLGLRAAHINAVNPSSVLASTFAPASKSARTIPESGLFAAIISAVVVAVPGLECMDGVNRLHSQAEPRGRRATLLAEAAALPAVLSAIAGRGRHAEAGERF